MPDTASFTLKYLGSTIVTNTVTTTTAVDTILNMAKISKRKSMEVTLGVTANGIVVTDCKTGSIILDASVYRISNCSTDPVRSSIFTFFATNKFDVTECHAFRCPKQKVAQTVTLTVAHSFRTAFETWQRGNQICDQLINQKAETEKCKTRNNFDTHLIDLSEAKENTKRINESISNNNSNWVRFENDKEDLFKGNPNFSR